MISKMSEETKSENTSIGCSDGNMSEQNLTVSTSVVLGFRNTNIVWWEAEESSLAFVNFFYFEISNLQRNCKTNTENFYTPFTQIPCLSVLAFSLPRLYSVFFSEPFENKLQIYYSIFLKYASVYCLKTRLLSYITRHPDQESSNIVLPLSNPYTLFRFPRFSQLCPLWHTNVCTHMQTHFPFFFSSFFWIQSASQGSVLHLLSCVFRLLLSETVP